MARRSLEDTLSPFQLLQEHGSPVTFATVQALLARAADAQKARCHHETGAYIAAAALAVTALERELTQAVAAEQLRLAEMSTRLRVRAAAAPAGAENGNRPRPDTSSPASRYSHSDAGGAALQPGGYSHSGRDQAVAFR